MLKVLTVESFLLIAFRCSKSTIAILSDEVVCDNSAFCYGEVAVDDDWTLS